MQFAKVSTGSAEQPGSRRAWRSPSPLSSLTPQRHCSDQLPHANDKNSLQQPAMHPPYRGALPRSGAPFGNAHRAASVAVPVEDEGMGSHVRPWSADHKGARVWGISVGRVATGAPSWQGLASSAALASTSAVAAAATPAAAAPAAAATLHPFAPAAVEHPTPHAGRGVLHNPSPQHRTSPSPLRASDHRCSRRRSD